MAFPPAHLLVGAGVAELVISAKPLPRWKAWLVGALLAALPDMDLVLGILVGTRGEYHGTFTHSLLAVAVVALVAWMLAGQRWAVLAGTTYASHLVVDLLDDRGRTNVLLGWPFTDERPFAIARVFPTVPFEHGGGILTALFSLFEPETFDRLLLQTAIAGIFAGALMLLAWGLRRVRLAQR